MRTTTTVAVTVLALCTALACCDDGEPGDGDGDLDSDVDSDVDSDADSDADPDADASADGDGDADLDRDGDAEGDEPCALPPPFDLGVVYERTIHVSTTGSDEGDGSAGSPLASISAAVRRASPGTRILVAEGTYRGSTYLSNVAGEPGRPIAIVAEGEVVLDAAGAGNVLQVSEARYLVLEGLTLRGGSANGLNIDDGGSYDSPVEHVVMRRLTVSAIGTGGNNDCIKLSGVDRFFLLDSDLSGCNAGDAVDMVGCHEGLIAGNRFHDTPSGGVQAKGGSADVLVHGNVFVDVRGRNVNAGGSTGLDYFRPADAPYEAARVHVVANLFVRSGAGGGAAIAFVGCEACVFANNTVLEPETWVARILQETVDERFVTCRDGLFVNNLVVLEVADLRTFVNVGAGTAPETFTFGSNLWYARDRDGSWAGPTLTDGIPPETGSIVQQDPLLADPASGDLHLRPGSPAEGAGREVASLAPMPPDHDGRCYGRPPTIGAFELD